MRDLGGNDAGALYTTLLKECDSKLRTGGDAKPASKKNKRQSEPVIQTNTAPNLEQNAAPNDTPNPEQNVAPKADPPAKPAKKKKKKMTPEEEEEKRRLQRERRANRPGAGIIALDD